MVNRKSCKDLHKQIRVEVDGKLIDLPPVEGIIILNILRYAAFFAHVTSSVDAYHWQNWEPTSAAKKRRKLVELGIWSQLMGPLNGENLIFGTSFVFVFVSLRSESTCGARKRRKFC